MSSSSTASPGLPLNLPLSELEDWLPLDKTLGAYLLGTFIGLMYVAKVRSLGWELTGHAQIVWP